MSQKVVSRDQSHSPSSGKMSSSTSSPKKVSKNNSKSSKKLKSQTSPSPSPSSSSTHSHDHGHSHSHSHSDSHSHPHPPPPPSSSSHQTEEDMEYAHWYDVMRTFLLYEDFIDLEIQEKQMHLNRLSEKLVQTLPASTFEKIEKLGKAAKINQNFFQQVVNFQDYGFAPRTRNSQRVEKHRGSRIHYGQMHRNQAVLHSLAREWSAYGAQERSKAFGPLLDALKRKLPVNMTNQYHQRVLVPGCGLARLPLEIASCGYSCEANEYSMFMLTASHFILNGVSQAQSIPIYPWIDRVSNVVHLSDVLEPVLIPDISPLDFMNPALSSIASSNDSSSSTSPLPSEIKEPDFMRFTMAAGNFVELYGGESQAGIWDAIVTCFFLDTAPVVMDYIQTIQTALKPGGYWINLGPLLYHWASSDPGVASGTPIDERYSQSIELSWEELEHVIRQYGFVIEEQEFIECSYTRALNSMLWNTYNAKFFIAKKPN